MKYALQLYTVRDSITDEKTLIDALQKLKKMGYDGVEFAGYYGIEPLRIKEILAETGMAGVGCHAGIDPLENDLENTLQSAAAIGLTKVSMSWSAADSPEEIAHTLRVLEAAKQAAKQYNIEILYHNHSHELRPVEGCNTLALEQIKQIVPLEVDLYWVFYAGLNPVAYFTKNQNHIGLVHIKDGKKAEAAPCALGEGENDCTGIYAAAKASGVEWLIVEDDTPTPNGLADAQRSIQWLLGMEQ